LPSFPQCIFLSVDTCCFCFIYATFTLQLTPQFSRCHNCLASSMLATLIKFMLCMSLELCTLSLSACVLWHNQLRLFEPLSTVGIALNAHITHLICKLISDKQLISVSHNVAHYCPIATTEAVLCQSNLSSCDSFYHMMNTNQATLIQIEARTSCAFRISDVLCNLA